MLLRMFCSNAVIRYQVLILMPVIWERKLAQEGALVYMGHAECQVDDVDAVVISSAIHQNNPD